MIDSRELCGGDPLWPEIQLAIEAAAACAVVEAAMNAILVALGKRLNADVVRVLEAQAAEADLLPPLLVEQHPAEGFKHQGHALLGESLAGCTSGPDVNPLTIPATVSSPSDTRHQSEMLRSRIQYSAERALQLHNSPGSWDPPGECCAIGSL